VFSQLSGRIVPIPAVKDGFDMQVDLLQKMIKPEIIVRKLKVCFNLAVLDHDRAKHIGPGKYPTSARLVLIADFALGSVKV